MLTKALVLTDGEADLLSRALEEVKTKTFEESQISLDDVEALNALVSHFREAEKVEPDKEARQISVNPLSKRLFLGHVIGREGSTDTASGSQGCPALQALDLETDSTTSLPKTGHAIIVETLLWLSKAKTKAQRTVCAFANLRQLTAAWVMYYGENTGSLVPANPTNLNTWVQGDMTNPSDAQNAGLIQSWLYG